MQKTSGDASSIFIHTFDLMRRVVTVTGGALAPLSLSGGGTHLHPVDAVAMVPREPQVPAD